MAYANPHHQGRLVLVAHVPNAFAALYVSNKPPGAIETTLLGAAAKPIYQLNQLNAHRNLDDLFNVPFIFHKDCKTPWHEANSYLLNLATDKHATTRPSDDMRRRAAKLLDYLMFCEDNNLDWLNFSGRPVHRPTYKYFSYLTTEAEPRRSPDVINQYTGVIYNFYKFISLVWHPINMDLVDSTKKIEFPVATDSGNIVIKTEKRSQTHSKTTTSQVPIGFVREESEDLRPLKNSELLELRQVITTNEWSAQERLIFMTALMTGARKQTVLTLRMKHLHAFTEDRLRTDGTYQLWAGPGTGIDTKKNKRQDLYFPKQLAEELIVLANSPMAKARRTKLRGRFAEEFPELEPLTEDNMYVFLSDQGNCYYLAKNDSRYPIVKSKPTGQVTDTVKRKLIGKASGNFPKDFSYHWLRATYAFQLYQRLQPLVESGRYNSGDLISFIQSRMHHERREVTENYLKLFKMHSNKLAAQEAYEDHLFGFSSYEDLTLRDDDERS